jgi:signal peptidase I
MSAFAHRIPASWATAAASVPLLVWGRDSLFGLCRVHGTSMEPAIKEGDILLVRKADRGLLLESLAYLVHGEAETDAVDTEERARLLRFDAIHGAGDHVPMSRLYENPPLALAGHVVVYKSPSAALPDELLVKRVTGVGGQHLRNQYGRRIQLIPPYTIYMEGDNKENSDDSRKTGPISKNLVVGIAEYVVWPPYRWRRIIREQACDELKRPRAYWP